MLDISRFYGDNVGRKSTVKSIQTIIKTTSTNAATTTAYSLETAVTPFNCILILSSTIDSSVNYPVSIGAELSVDGTQVNVSVGGNGVNSRARAFSVTIIEFTAGVVVKNELINVPVGGDLIGITLDLEKSYVCASDYGTYADYNSSSSGFGTAIMPTSPTNINITIVRRGVTSVNQAGTVRLIEFA